jgi:hypothetical protein
LPRAKPYRLAGQGLKRCMSPSRYRSEYDHLMLQLHDGMKGEDYQRNGAQLTVPLPPAAPGCASPTRPRMRS